MFFELSIFILIGLILRILLTVEGTSPEKIDFLRDKINKFVFYYVIPFICFKTTYTIPLTLSHLKVSLVANLTILSSVSVCWLVYKNFRNQIESKVIGALIMCSSFGNVLYIGLPILTKLYGKEGMSYAFTYDFLASTPLTWTLAVAVCMYFGGKKGIKIKNSLLTIFKIPPIWGLIIGFFLRESNINIPQNFIKAIDLISSHVTFFMLLIVGLSIKTVTPKKLIISLPAIIIKLFISPLFALTYGIIFGLKGIPLNVCIIEAGTPSMLLSMIFAAVFGVDMRTSVEMIFITTIGFFFNMVVFTFLLN